MDKKITGLKLFLLLFWQVSFAQQTILTDSNLPIMVISTDIDPATNSPIDIPDEPKFWLPCNLFIDLMEPGII